MILIGNGRIVAQGDKESLLRTTHTGALVTSTDNDSLAGALTAAGLTAQAAGTGLRVAAEPVQVGTVAAQHGFVLIDLRPDATPLEDLFLALTSDSQRDDVPAVEEGAHA
jgi:ABC-2 type transport system ATP-binding protein